MKIVHASPFFDPATCFGGPVAQLRCICPALAARGHEVAVVTSELGIGPDLPRERWIDRDGFRVWYARVGPMGRFAPYHMPRAAHGLAEALDGADVLHLSLSFTHLNLLGRREAMRRGVPYVYAPRSCLDPVRLREKRLAKMAFLALFERRIIRDAAAVHALTEAERIEATAQGARPGQVSVIPNAASLDPDAEFPDGAPFRTHAGIDRDTPMVLYLGRLHRIKGLELLVDAFAAAAAAVPEAQLVFAGPDEGGRAIIEARVRRHGLEGRVQMVGTIDGDLRLSALRAADLFALTSLSEGMPNAVLEACAVGTAVLVTEACKLPEIASAGAGRVVPARTAEVASAMAEMLRLDPAERRRMGERGRALVRQSFGVAAVTAALESLYRGLAAGSRRAAA